MEATLTTMARFSKDNLSYTYKWDNSTRLSHKKTLDRTCGQEVLQFINDFFNAQNLGSTLTFKKAEYLLYNHLPINIKNKTEISSWLIRHWDNDF